MLLPIGTEYVLILIILTMLIKSEVSRRVETINTHILALKQKVYEKDYRQAKELIKMSKNQINNNYLAPYDPNVYVLDTIKARREKLLKQKEELSQVIQAVSSRIEGTKLKRGYCKSNQQFIPKLVANNVGVYASRLNLALKDSNRIDYQLATIMTDFHIVKVEMEGTSNSIPFSSIITFQSENTEILISWQNQKNKCESFIIIRFDYEEERVKWDKAIKFSRLICQSKQKNKLFQKSEVTVPEFDDQEQKEQKLRIGNKDNYQNSKLFNFHTASGNKTAYYDRIRRQSEHDAFHFNHIRKSFHQPEKSFEFDGVRSASKSRKISQDLSMKWAHQNRNNFFNEKKLTRFKSQKSFDEISHSNSQKTNKKSEINQLSDEKEKFKKTEMKKGSNKQPIFFNESSIHWIQQEREDEKSKSSYVSKALQNEQKILTIFGNENSEHISEDPAEIDESPLLKNRNKRDINLVVEAQAKLAAQGQMKENSVAQQKSEKIEEAQYLLRVEPVEFDKSGESQSEQISNSQSKHEHGQDNEQDHETSMDQVSDTLRFDLDKLNKGIKVLKCAENGWNPHEKILYLSINLLELCWTDDQKKDLKKVRLSQIEDICYRKYGKGITRHVKTHIETNRCLIIKTSMEKQKNIKNLQFYYMGTDPEELEDFAQKLCNYVKFKKGL